VLLEISKDLKQALTDWYFGMVWWPHYVLCGMK